MGPSCVCFCCDLVASLLCCPAAAQTAVHTPPNRLACPGDLVVWLNTKTGVNHFKGGRGYFGNTKQRMFICGQAARAEGDRPARNGR